jgi:hypothetical protein
MPRPCFVTVTFGNAGLGKIHEAMCPLNLGLIFFAVLDCGVELGLLHAESSEL